MALAFSARSSSARVAALVIVGTAAVAALSACAPEPAPSSSSSAPAASSSAPSSPPPSTGAPSVASPSATPTQAPAADIELPSSCPEIYTAAMFDGLNAEVPPLNDPGVTLLSTEVTAGLEVLDVAPTIRCSWGTPSEFGMATNVTIVDSAQSATVAQALLEAGMSCEESAGGTLCRVEGEHREGEAIMAKFGETHFLGGNGWVATHWINVSPEGYTEDIISTLWG